jgi:hypothetical protein
MCKITLILSFILFINVKVYSSSDSTQLIEKGTVLKVRSLNNLKSNKVVEGDEIELEVYEDLVVNDNIVIKARTPVLGYVESFEKAKLLGKEGLLIIQITSTKAVDKTFVPLRIYKSSIYGEDKSDASIALSLLVSPAFLLKRGGQAKVKEGKIFNTYVTRDVKISYR